MKKIILILTIISSLLLVSCNKNEVINNEYLPENNNEQVYEEETDNLEDNDAMVIIENYLNLLAKKEGSYQGLFEFLELVDEVTFDENVTVQNPDGITELMKTNIKYADFKNKLLTYMSLNCFETFTKGFEEKDGDLYTLPLGATGYSCDVYEVNLKEKNDNSYVYRAKAKYDAEEKVEERSIEITIIKESDRYVVDSVIL